MKVLPARRESPAPTQVAAMTCAAPRMSSAESTQHDTTYQSIQPASQPDWTHAIMHKPTGFIRGVGVGVAAARLQHIQLLCCLKMSQLKVLYFSSHVLYLKHHQGTPPKGPGHTTHKGLYIFLKRVSTNPSTVPLHPPQKGL